MNKRIKKKISRKNDAELSLKTFFIMLEGMDFCRLYTNEKSPYIPWRFILKKHNLHKRNVRLREIYAK